MPGKGIDFPLDIKVDKKSLETQVKNAVKPGAEKGVKEGTSKGIKEGLKSQLPSAAKAITGTFTKAGLELARGSKSALTAASALNSSAENLTKSTSQARSYQPKITAGVAEAGIRKRQREVVTAKRSQQAAGPFLGAEIQKTIDRLTGEIESLRSAISGAAKTGTRRFHHPTANLTAGAKGPDLDVPSPPAKRVDFGARSPQDPFQQKATYQREQQTRRSSEDTRRRRLREDKAREEYLVKQGAYVPPAPVSKKAPIRDKNDPRVTARPKSQLPDKEVVDPNQFEGLMQRLSSRSGTKEDLARVTSLPKEQQPLAKKALVAQAESEDLKTEQTAILRELQKSTLSAKQRTDLEGDVVTLVKLYNKAYNEALQATEELARLRKKSVQAEKTQVAKSQKQAAEPITKKPTAAPAKAPVSAESGAVQPILRKKQPPSAESTNAPTPPPPEVIQGLDNVDKQLAELKKPIKSAQKAVQRLDPEDKSDAAEAKRRRVGELIQDRSRLQAQRATIVADKKAAADVLRANVTQTPISTAAPKEDVQPKVKRGRPALKDILPPGVYDEVQDLKKQADKASTRARRARSEGKVGSAVEFEGQAAELRRKRNELKAPYEEAAKAARKEAAAANKAAAAEEKRAQAKASAKPISKSPPDEDKPGKGGRDEDAILREIIAVRQRYKEGIEEHVSSSVASLSRMAAADRKMASLAEAALKARQGGGAAGAPLPGGAAAGAPPIGEGPTPPPTPPGGGKRGGGPPEDEDFSQSAYDQYARAQSSERSRKESEGSQYTEEDFRRATHGPYPGSGSPYGGGTAGGGPPPGGGDVPPGGGTPPGDGGGTVPPVDEWRSSIQRMWATITESLKEAPEKIAKLDTSAIFQATPYRELAGRHEQELKKESPQGIKGGEEIAKQFKGIQTSTQERLNVMVKNLRDLANAADAPTETPASDVRRNINQIKKLSSETEEGVQFEGDPKEIKAYKRQLEKFVQGATKKIVAGLLEQNRALEKAIDTAAKAGNKGQVESLAQEFGANVRKMEEIYDISEKAGPKFDVTRQRTTKGKGFTPSSPIPEAQFRHQDFAGRNAAKALEKEGFGAANDAAEAARDFEGIADEAKRIKAVFDSLFQKAKPDSLEFRKNLTGVIERLKRQATEGIIDRAEVEATIKTLEQYNNQVRTLRLGEVGLRKPGAIRIPGIFEQAEAGGSQKEFLRQVDRQREEVARGRGKTGPRVEQFEFQDSSGAIRKMNVEYRKLGNSIDSVRVKAKETSKVLSGREQFGLAFKRVALWGTAAGVTYGAISAFRDAMRTMVEAEAGVVSLSKVMEEADFGFKEFTMTVNNFVQNTTQKFAASMREAYDVMRIFAQQGKNMADTMKLTEASFLGANISILTQKEVAEALTATTKQFNIEASQSESILDAWNEVSNKNAVTMKTLADATKKAGAAAKVVGIEFEQFLGLVTAVSEATRQPGKQIGTSLRFIFQRTLRPETQKELAKVGLSTTDLEGNFKGFIPVITELADKWDSLTRSQKLSIAQALGGARQYNVFLALMENFDKAVKASAEAVNSQGSAQRENTKYMQTAEANMKKAKAAIDAMYVSMGSTLLPVIKKVSEGVVSMAKGFQNIPNWAKGATAAMLAFAVAGTRVAQSLDYVLASQGATTAGAGIGSVITGGIIGRGKTPEQLAAMPIEKQLALSKGGRIGKGFTDIGYAGLGIGGLGVGRAGVGKKLGRGVGDIGAQLKAQGQQLYKLDTSRKAVTDGMAQGFKGSATWVEANTTKMSKLNAVVKGYGVSATGASNAASLGMQSLNSPLTAAVVLFTSLTKGVARLGIHVVALIPQIVGLFNTWVAGAVAANKATVIAKVNALGLLGTAVLAVALGTAIYYAVDAMWDLGKAADKTHQQVAKDFEAEIAEAQKRLRLSNAEVASLKRVEAQRRKLANIKPQTPEERDTSIRQGTYKSPLINALRFDELQQKAGASVAKVDPAAIESIDKYGRVVLNTSKSMIGLASASVAAQAQLTAFLKTKVAAAAAGQANKAFKKLGVAVKQYSDILPEIKSRSNIFRLFGNYSEDVNKLGINLIKARQALTGYVKVLEDTFAGLPKSTPVESFVAALGNPKILKAFSTQVEGLNSALVGLGKGAATAGDLMNKLFLKSKGFKNVGVTGQVTEESFKERKLLGKSLEKIDKELKQGKQVLKGNELITFGPEGPFGLTQARIYIDEAGRYMVQGINSVGIGITTELANVKNELTRKGQSAFVFDPTVLVEQFNTSIAKARKVLGGAGAGLIKFPAEIDLGVKFSFLLGDLDYLQSSSRAASEMITRVSVAQQGYTKTLGEFNKSSKENPGGKRSTDQLNKLNEDARIVSQSTFLTTLAVEITKLGKAAEKASYDMKSANIQDAVSQQFAAMSTSAKGFSEDLVFKLPKLQSQLSPVERVTQSNPELAKSIRASDRAVELIKQQAKAFAVTTDIDIPKLFDESGAANQQRFLDRPDQLLGRAEQERKAKAENLKRFGGAKPFAALSDDLTKINKTLTTGFDLVATAIKLGGKEKDKKTGKDTATDNAKKLVGIDKKVVGSTYTMDRFMRSIAEKGRRDDLGPFFRKVEDRLKEIRAANAKEVKKRAAEGKSTLKVGKDGRVTATNVDSRKEDAAAIARVRAGESTYAAEGVKRYKREVASAKYLISKTAITALTNTREDNDDKAARGIIAKGIGYVSEQKSKWFEETIWRPLRRLAPQFKSIGFLGEDYGTKEKVSATSSRRSLSAARARLRALEATTPSQHAEALRKSGASEDRAYTKAVTDITNNQKIIAETNKFAKAAVEEYAKATKKLIDKKQKEVQVINESLKAIGLVATANKDLATSITQSVRGLLSFGKQLKALGPLTAPIVGAGAGIPQGRIDIGKSPGELSAYERLFKSFPEFVGNLTRQEQVRQKALSELPGIYQKLQKQQALLGEATEKSSNPELRAKLLSLGARGKTMWEALSGSVRNMNTQMRPLLKSFAEMQRLESVRKSIEDIVKALKKAEDLEFDTTSLDKALGKHPLAATAGVYGQPAGLNKFERQQFELDQKRRAGSIGGGQYNEQKRKIEFERDEAVIQYNQNKENAKLQSEVGAAKNAMGLLWDAQYQGIDGLQPLIDTIKSELETAGDVTEFGGQREFQGVPSLQGIQEALVKVQSQKRALNYRQQRDIVMGETERLLSDMLALMKEADKAVDRAKDDVGGGTVEAIQGLIDSFKEAFSANAGLMANLVSAVQKTLGKSSPATGIDSDKLSDLNTKFAEAMQKVGKSFSTGTKQYVTAIDVFNKAASKITDALDKVVSVTSAGIKKPVATDKGPTATGPNDLKRATGGYVVANPAKYFIGGAVSNSTTNNYQDGGPVGSIPSGYIRGSEQGVDNKKGKVPVGGYIINKAAVRDVGLSNLNKIKKDAAGGSSGEQFATGGHVDARVTPGEFLFGPREAAVIGKDRLSQLNRVGGGKIQKGTKFGPGGDILTREEINKKMLALQQHSSATKGVEGNPSRLDSLTTYQLATVRKKYIASAYSEPQVGVTYRGDGTPKVSKEASAAAFKEIDDRKRVIDIGSGRPKKFTLTKENEAEVYGRVLTDKERAELKARYRTSFIRRKYNRYKRNKTKAGFAELQKLASSIDLANVDPKAQQRDLHLLKGLQGGWTPEQYDQVLARRNFIKEQLDPRLDKNTAVGKKIYMNTAKKERDLTSGNVLYDKLLAAREKRQKRRAYVKDKFRSFKEISRNSTPSETAELRRKMLNEIINSEKGWSRDQSAESYAELYRMVASLHVRTDKDGKQVNFIPGQGLVGMQHLQKAYKGDKTSGFKVRWRGKNIRVVLWKDPKTGQRAWVRKKDIRKDGTLKERVTTGSNGELTYNTFKVPLRKDNSFEAITGEDVGDDGKTAINAEGFVKSILGRDYGKTHKGAVGVSSTLMPGKDVSQLDTIIASRFRREARFLGIGHEKKGFLASAGRLGLGFTHAFQEVGLGLYGLGKQFKSEYDKGGNFFSGVGKGLGKTRDSIRDGMFRSINEFSANIGFSEGDKNSGGATQDSFVRWAIGRRIRKHIGFSDKGEVELTPETGGKWIRDLALTGASFGTSGTLKELLIGGLKRGVKRAAASGFAKKLAAGKLGRGFIRVQKYASGLVNSFKKTGLVRALTKQRHVFGDTGLGLFRRSGKGGLRFNEAGYNKGLSKKFEKDLLRKRKDAAKALDRQRQAALKENVAGVAGVSEKTAVPLRPEELSGFAKQYADVDNIGTLDLLRQGRTTTPRLLLRGIAKLGGRGEFVAKKIGYFLRKRLKAERRRALELGLDPSSRFVSKRGYNEARHILDSQKKTGFFGTSKIRDRITHKFIDKKKLAGELLDNKKGPTGRTKHVRRNASEKAARKKGIDEILRGADTARSRRIEGLSGYDFRGLRQIYTKNRTRRTFREWVGDLWNRRKAGGNIDLGDVNEASRALSHNRSGGKQITEAEFEAAVNARRAGGVARPIGSVDLPEIKTTTKPVPGKPKVETTRKYPEPGDEKWRKKFDGMSPSEQASFLRSRALSANRTALHRGRVGAFDEISKKSTLGKRIRADEAYYKGLEGRLLEERATLLRSRAYKDDLLRLRSRKERQAAVSGVTSTKSILDIKAVPSGRASQLGKVGLAPGFERELVRFKVRAKKTARAARRIEGNRSVVGTIDTKPVSDIKAVSAGRASQLGKVAFESRFERELVRKRVGAAKSSIAKDIGGDLAKIRANTNARLSRRAAAKAKGREAVAKLRVRIEANRKARVDAKEALQAKQKRAAQKAVLDLEKKVRAPDRQVRSVLGGIERPVYTSPSELRRRIAELKQAGVKDDVIRDIVRRSEQISGDPAQLRISQRVSGAFKLPKSESPSSITRQASIIQSKKAAFRRLYEEKGFGKPSAPVPPAVRVAPGSGTGVQVRGAAPAKKSGVPSSIPAGSKTAEKTVPDLLAQRASNKELLHGFKGKARDLPAIPPTPENIAQLRRARLGGRSTQAGKTVPDLLAQRASSKEFIQGFTGKARNLPAIPPTPENIIELILARLKGKFNKGGFVRKFAVGGPVFGAGGPTSDSIPAQLSNGEYVLNAKTVKSLGGFKGVDSLVEATGNSSTGPNNGGYRGGGGRRSYDYVPASTPPKGQDPQVVYLRARLDRAERYIAALAGNRAGSRKSSPSSITRRGSIASGSGSRSRSITGTGNTPVNRSPRRSYIGRRSGRGFFEDSPGGVGGFGSQFEIASDPSLLFAQPEDFAEPKDKSLGFSRKNLYKPRELSVSSENYPDFGDAVVEGFKRSNRDKEFANQAQLMHTLGASRKQIEADLKERGADSKEVEYYSDYGRSSETGVKPLYFDRPENQNAPGTYIGDKEGGYNTDVFGAPYAAGGRVLGRGTGTSDSITVRLSNGEYVIPSNVVSRYGADAFDNLISGKERKFFGGGLIQKFKNGGLALSDTGDDRQSDSVSPTVGSLMFQDIPTGKIGKFMQEWNAHVLKLEKQIDDASVIVSAQQKNIPLALAEAQAGLPEKQPAYTRQPSHEQLLARRGKLEGSTGPSTQDLLARRGKLEGPAGSPEAGTGLVGEGGAGTIGLLSAISEGIKSLAAAFVPGATSADVSRPAAAGGDGEDLQSLPKKDTKPVASQLLPAVKKKDEPAGPGSGEFAEPGPTKTVPDKQAGAASGITDALKSAADSIKTAITEAFQEAKVGITDESIQSVGRAVKRGVEEGAGSIAEVIKNAAPTAAGTTGLGAAVRPSEFEALQGRVEILNEKMDDVTTNLDDTVTGKIITATTDLKTEIQYTRDQDQTELNERFSTIKDEVALTVRNEFNPKINTNVEDIVGVKHDVNTVMSLVQSVRARVETS